MKTSEALRETLKEFEKAISKIRFSTKQILKAIAIGLITLVPTVLPMYLFIRFFIISGYFLILNNWLDLAITFTVVPMIVLWFLFWITFLDKKGVLPD